MKLELLASLLQESDESHAVHELDLHVTNTESYYRAAQKIFPSLKGKNVKEIAADSRIKKIVKGAASDLAKSIDDDDTARLVLTPDVLAKATLEIAAGYEEEINYED